VSKKEGNIKIYEDERTRIIVNEGWCKACGICINFCPKNVFNVNDNGFPVAERITDCIHCMLCELRCPDFAIGVGKKEEEFAADDLEKKNLED